MLGECLDVLGQGGEPPLAVEDPRDAVGEALPLFLRQLQSPEVEQDFVAGAAGAATGFQQSVNRYWTCG